MAIVLVFPRAYRLSGVDSPMGDAMNYDEFLQSKMQLSGEHGFEPLWMPDFLFDFQRSLTTWALRKGRAAIFADTGLGKTIMQLVWAENVVRKTGGRVLIFTPLAVAWQTEHEAEKFGIEAKVSRGGALDKAHIIITNYEQLHYFDQADFVGTVCDESGCLKNFDGMRKAAITEFMRQHSYRLLCTATAAPNDYIELGTSSEALGELGYMDMLQRFFKSNNNSYAHGSGASGRTRFRNLDGKFRLRGHAERDFWRWICSWARAIRKPSDINGEDSAFILPPLISHEHIVKAHVLKEGMLFDMPAVGLQEQREERRRTIKERCEMAASLVNGTGRPAICWCHLNSEGDLLTRLIPDAVQVAGRDSDEHKENTFRKFQNGEIRVLVSKPSIAGFGLNFQHCAHQTFFPSHSFEQWYQAVRRCWRFGQKNPVTIDVISSEGERDVLDNLQRKQDAADAMFTNLINMMRNTLKISVEPYRGTREEMPSWLRKTN